MIWSASFFRKCIRSSREKGVRKHTLAARTTQSPSRYLMRLCIFLSLSSHFSELSIIVYMIASVRTCCTSVSSIFLHTFLVRLSSAPYFCSSSFNSTSASLIYLLAYATAISFYPISLFAVFFFSYTPAKLLGRFTFRNHWNRA